MTEQEIPSLSQYDFLQTDALIDGHWQAAMDGTTFAVDNPATGEIIAQVANCGAQETRLAITAAANAQAAWAQVPAKQKSRLLRAWFDLIIANENELAYLLTLEQGKPMAEALGEVRYGASYVEWFSEEVKRIYGDVIPAPGIDKRIVTLKQPVGVVACITPWNFPNAMLARKIAPALAAGCTVVCKPANETPLSALALGYYAIEAGIPPGVINMLCGKTAEIGDELTSSPEVRKLTFTGSTQVGKMLTAACSQTMKRTSMELGGNAAVIIDRDADLKDALPRVIKGAFYQSGQSCISVQRILIHEDVYDEFRDMLVEEAKALVAGDPKDKDTFIGPMIDVGEAERVEAWTKEALDHGAKLLCGGTREGRMIPATLLENVDRDAKVVNEEVFGPLAVLMKFSTFDEAIEETNRSEFGLQAGIFTRDLFKMFDAWDRLDYGGICINEIPSYRVDNMPYGGVKNSGLGREGVRFAMEDMTEIRNLVIRRG